MSENEVVQSVPKKETKIFVAIPTIGYIDSFVAHSLIEFMVDIVRLESKGYKFILAMIPRMLVAQARELSVEKAIETNSDYLMFIDDDMLLPRGLLERLLSHKLDIVGAMSFERLGDNNPNIYKLFSHVTDKDENIDKVSMRWRNILDYKGIRNENGIIECDVIGFGAVLLNMNIFKGENKIEPPYFMSQFQVGEDFFFCWKAKEKGYKVYADCSDAWLLGHLGDSQVITDKTFALNMANKKTDPEQTEQGIK